MFSLHNYMKKIPDFTHAQFLIRIPLAIVFILQGLAKIPVDPLEAESMGLPMSVWFFVAWGELFAGIGLIIGGLLFTKSLNSLGGLITRFSGITMTCVVTGVIWLMAPSSFWDVIWRDYLHVSLYVGGLYFALRGNAKYG